MARRGIIEPVTEGKAITEHVADYKAALFAKGNTADYVEETDRKLLDIMGDCKKLGDVKTANLRAELNRRRAPRPKTDSHGKEMKDETGELIPNGNRIQRDRQWDCNGTEYVRWVTRGYNFNFGRGKRGIPRKHYVFF
jgi:hypothetical protein